MYNGVSHYSVSINGPVKVKATYLDNWNFELKWTGIIGNDIFDKVYVQNNTNQWRGYYSEYAKLEFVSNKQFVPLYSLFYLPLYNINNPVPVKTGNFYLANSSYSFSIVSEKESISWFDYEYGEQGPIKEPHILPNKATSFIWQMQFNVLIGFSYRTINITLSNSFVLTPNVKNTIAKHYQDFISISNY